MTTMTNNPVAQPDGVVERNMVLPAGKTCNDCVFFRWCEGLFQCPPESTTCDFAPSRFKESWPNASPPERLYLRQNTDGLWVRTAFGDLPNVAAYVRAPSPDSIAEQSWCDHCSADLDSVRHTLCEKCYRFIAGPKVTDVDFDPSKGSPDAIASEPIAEKARRIAKQVVPDCLSRTCFIKDSHREHCWGCDDSKAERERVAAIITAEFTTGGNNLK